MRTRPLAPAEQPGLLGMPGKLNKRATGTLETGPSVLPNLTCFLDVLRAVVG